MVCSNLYLHVLDRLYKEGRGELEAHRLLIYRSSQPSRAKKIHGGHQFQSAKEYHIYSTVFLIVVENWESG